MNVGFLSERHSRLSSCSSPTSPNPCLPPLPTHHPPQVSVPAVLQRRLVALGELGFQHGSSSTSRPPPGQHHSARQRAGSAIDGGSSSTTPGGATCLPSCLLPKKRKPTHLRTRNKLTFSSTDSELLLDCRHSLEETERHREREREPRTDHSRAEGTPPLTPCLLLHVTLRLLCCDRTDGGRAAQLHLQLD